MLLPADTLPTETQLYPPTPTSSLSSTPHVRSPFELYPPCLQIRDCIPARLLSSDGTPMTVGPNLFAPGESP
jgi:hypothetical protein